jgi:broad specificity phosphatase PhoE
MPTTIYFIRHGTSENKDSIAYGRMPGFPLSQQGQEEAKKAAKVFLDKKILKIYTSPLERAFQTANIISETLGNIPIVHSFELNEVESTYWQGLKADELFMNDAYEKFLNDSDANIGTENLTQLAARMKKFVRDLLEKHRGESILCVSHEFPIIALKLSYENKPLQTVKTYHLKTGEIFKFVFDDSGNLAESGNVNAV